MTTPVTIAGHVASFDASGQLLPWTSWNAALDREMNFYQQCPLTQGYPRFACETFMDAAWTPSTERTDIIPATQNGMGILSYLKFYGMHGETQPAMLATARRSHPAITWIEGDIPNWAPTERYDVVFSNAALQWVPDHAALLPKLLTAVAPVVSKLARARDVVAEVNPAGAGQPALRKPCLRPS